jgi:ABC-2 type transport system permease protein
MFREFFRFEVMYWLRGWMIYLFIAAIAIMFGLAAGSDTIQIGGPTGNAYKNAPYTIAIWYASAGILTCFMAAAIYDSCASRDFSNKMSDLMFSKPLSKWGFLLGRFLGATLIAILPAMGITIGILAAHAVNASDTERWGPNYFWHHWQPFVLFVIPNTLLFGSIVFAISTVTRNTLYSFLGILLIFVLYAISATIAGALDYEVLASWTDPFGVAPYLIASKYWTVPERNTLPIPLTSLLIGNRLLFLGLSMAVFGVAGKMFSFEARTRGPSRRSSVREETRDVPEHATHTNPLPIRVPSPSWVTQWFSTLRSDLRAVVGSATFVVILLFCLLNTLVSLFLSDLGAFNVSTLPVTYDIVERILGSLLILPLALATYFGGVLVWRDRESRIHELIGATPTPNSVFVVSRLATMVILLLAVLAGGIAVGCFYQWIYGYYRFQLDVYVLLLIVFVGSSMFFLAVQSFFAQTIAPNKYAGYAFLILFGIVNSQLWRWLRWESLLLRFGRRPNYTYSDMFGIAPYLPGQIWFSLYWLAVAIVVLWLCTVLMPRGAALGWIPRLREAWHSLRARDWILPGMAAATAAGIGTWLGYNTMVLNTLLGSAERENRQIEYEKKYKVLSDVPQPKIQSVQYAIDIFPETRNMVMKGNQTIANRSNKAIDTFYLNVDSDYDTTLEIPGATLESNDERLSLRTYKLAVPMEPGEVREMRYEVRSKTRGIENEVSNATLVQNGTFFNNGIAPSFGFSAGRLLRDPQRRKDLGVPEIEAFPELTRECGDVCRIHYVAEDSDWVNVETVISTSQDQIAVAPGSLVESWTENGRNYYRYRVDHPSLNFYSFISAKYEVKRDRVGDVDTEVYYHKDHPWNVDKMSKAIGNTLEYCNEHFGPYRHKQARIIEFPRVAEFAQAFPGTMPYSEAIGFIANLEKPDDIDGVTYVVAHEMGHQWWAHQVVGARMQGATLLSETLAQYTALMIMRKTYGDDMIHKFLRYEMDRYLRARSFERRKERPLLMVEPEQSYIHYQKGGIALYYLAEMIGEARVNAALKSVVDSYAYQGPPYPTAYALVDRLREQTPPELHYLIRDLFEEITLFGNRTKTAAATKTEDGKYLVKISVECRKYKSDETGNETEAAMDDFVEIGAFAKAEPGKRYGKLLYRKRVQLSHGTHELEFVVDEKPHEAGIDPRNLLIDRVPDDNLKRIVLK